jgi:hypothetical protein
MTTRRAFMQIAAAAAAPVALGVAPALASSASGHRFALFEGSSASAAVFARRARLHGIATLEVHQGDITDVWLKAVRPAWRSANASITGVTTPAALFCLEQFAWAQGMRVVFHAEHLLLPDGGVEHQVQRTLQPLSSATLRRAGERWPQRLADALSRQRPRNMFRPGPSLAALEPTLPAGATLLTSWIIA